MKICEGKILGGKGVFAQELRDAWVAIKKPGVTFEMLLALKSHWDGKDYSDLNSPTLSHYWTPHF